MGVSSKGHVGCSWRRCTSAIIVIEAPSHGGIGCSLPVICSFVWHCLHSASYVLIRARWGLWSVTFIAPPHPGLAQIRCSCCRACTNRPCAARSCSVFMMPPSRFSLQGWGLIDLPLRASNEHILIVRVPRAQEIIRLHPFLCSASKKGTQATIYVFLLCHSEKGGQLWLNCARPTRAFRGRALREQRAEVVQPSHTPHAPLT
jgi:hypothetical protein